MAKPLSTFGHIVTVVVRDVYFDDCAVVYDGISASPVAPVAPIFGWIRWIEYSIHRIQRLMSLAIRD
jgi:hypothetical protein